jgi:hypothetical protein
MIVSPAFSLSTSGVVFSESAKNLATRHEGTKKDLFFDLCDLVSGGD